MERFGYIGMLAFTVCGSFWLELILHVGVFRQTRRLALTLLPTASIFVVWDWYAIAHHQWGFDSHQTLNIRGPLAIPLEEYLFFLIVPIAAILTYEAVLKRKPHWAS